MTFNWFTCPSDIRQFVYHILDEMKVIIDDHLLGFYIHGSLALGGFNPKNSDIDMIVITTSPLSVENKRELAQVFLKCSNYPYPVEASFLNKGNLRNWNHPSPFDFHYSEFWRGRYEYELKEGTNFYLNDETKKDIDLAAHMTITYHRGICLVGSPIKDVFPAIPHSHYLSSIMSDFQDCLNTVEQQPVYSILNMLRVYWYAKEGTIASKKEAGEWGLSHLPNEFNLTIQRVLCGYENGDSSYTYDTDELLLIRDFFKGEVDFLLND